MEKDLPQHRFFFILRLTMFNKKKDNKIVITRKEFIRIPPQLFEIFNQIDPYPLKILIYFYGLSFYRNGIYEPVSPSFSEIEKECGLTRQTAFNSVKYLEDIGLIKKVKHKNFNQYILNQSIKLNSLPNRTNHSIKKNTTILPNRTEVFYEIEQNSLSNRIVTPPEPASHEAIKAPIVFNSNNSKNSKIEELTCLLFEDDFEEAQNLIPNDWKIKINKLVEKIMAKNPIQFEPISKNFTSIELVKMLIDCPPEFQEDFIKCVVLAFVSAFENDKVKVDKRLLSNLKYYRTNGNFPKNVLKQWNFIESKLDEFLLDDKEKRKLEWKRQEANEKKWEKHVQIIRNEEEMGEKLIVKLEKENPEIYDKLMIEAMSQAGKASQAIMINDKKYEKTDEIKRREQNLDFTTHRIFRAKVTRYYKNLEKGA
jgi:hypothetical protein